MSHSHHRILLVDDERDVARGMALLLRTLGHTVVVVYDGHHALQAARSLEPTVVLLDLKMPVMNGYQLARRLRREYGPQLRLVAHTALDVVELAEQIRAAGFDAWLSKPVSTADLLASFDAQGFSWMR